MNDEEYKVKYANLRILKSIQEYLKEEGNSQTVLFPIRVPDDLLYQVIQLQGTESADQLVHQIFRVGLTIWSERVYQDVFGTERNLEDFIELVKERTRKKR